MSLKASERAALLRGEWPSLSRDYVEGEPAPFKVGEEFIFKRVGKVPQVWVTILSVKRTRKGQWKTEYSFRDDRPLFLRHNGDLTRSAAESCDPEADVIDPETQKAFSMKARLAAAERKRDRPPGKVSELSESERRRRERAIRDRLRERLAGLDPIAADALLAAIERDIAQAEDLATAA